MMPMRFGPSLSIAMLAGACLGAVGAVAADEPGGARAAHAPVTPIEHLIVIVGENRSFDNVLGTYEPIAAGESVRNLLSQGIVRRDGSPGPNFARALQTNPAGGGPYTPTPGAPASARGDAAPEPYARLPQPRWRGERGKGADGADSRYPADLPNGPYPLTPRALYGELTGNPVHRFFQMWQQVDGGRSDLFVWVANEAGVGPSNGGATARPGNTGQGGVPMGFFRMSAGDAPYFQYLASEFALSDNHHQPVMGGTTANFLALATGDAAAFVDAQGRFAKPPARLVENPDARPGTKDWYTEDGYDGGSYAACADRTQPGVRALRDLLSALPYRAFRDGNCDPGAYYLVNNLEPAYAPTGAPYERGEQSHRIPPQRIPHIGDALTKAGVSWKWYSTGRGDGTHPAEGYCATCDPFTAFASTMTGPDRARLVDLSNFFDDVQGADGAGLPSVSFVTPDDEGSGHPGESTLMQYERFVGRIVQAVRNNPGLWRRSAILVTVDEGGGFYDSGYIQFLDFFGDGTRIPLFAVSPWARHGHVDHAYSDHVSILKFIERNWRLAPLSLRSRDNLPNPVADPANPYVPANRPAIGDLMPLFDFQQELAPAGPGDAQYEATADESRRSDWAGLRRYLANDEAVKRLPPDPARVVLLGDSITDGWPAEAGLWDPHFVNRGISGQTTPQMLLRMRSDVIDIGAKTLVLLAGTNDIAANTGPITDEGIEANIATMAELARAHGMRVALCSILPVKAYPWSPTLRPAGRVLAVNAWMREYARKNGFTFVDYHAAMKDAEDGLPKVYSEDGVHPNAAGYAVMKRVLSEALAGSAR